MNTPAEYDRAVGQLLRARRIHLGLTQHEFAKQIGVTYQQAHKYENGQNRVSAGRLLAAAHALQISVCELLADIDKPPEPDALQREILALQKTFARLQPHERQAIGQLARSLRPGRSR